MNRPPIEAILAGHDDNAIYSGKQYRALAEYALHIEDDLLIIKANLDDAVERGLANWKEVELLQGLIAMGREFKMLNILRDEIHRNALIHGWWDEQRSFGDIVSLCHSELSEALEEHRSGHSPTEIYYPTIDKPEGIPIELADCIIRILDYCGHEGIDIAQAVITKHEFNKTRPYRHGGKKL